jgi:Ca2+-binding EF-hand superfamily protein
MLNIFRLSLRAVLLTTRNDAAVAQTITNNLEEEISMKRFSIMAAGLLALILTAATLAQDPTASPQGRRSQGGKLRKLDANNDGQITREEWKGKPKGFARLDRDNDNIISREEAASARRAHGKRQFKQMDANNDGQISRAEWTGDAELFTKLDVNNDGVIAKDERKGRRKSQ